MSDIKTTYRDIEITYKENNNEWTCDLFASPAATLLLAKERIDKKLDAEKKRPFKKFDAFVRSFGFTMHGKKSWPVVQITSITDDGKEAWATDGNERKKVGGSYQDRLEIYPAGNSMNAALVAKIHALEQKKNEIEKQIAHCESGMVPWKAEL